MSNVKQLTHRARQLVHAYNGAIRDSNTRLNGNVGVQVSPAIRLEFLDNDGMWFAEAGRCSSHNSTVWMFEGLSDSPESALERLIESIGSRTVTVQAGEGVR